MDDIESQLKYVLEYQRHMAKFQVDVTTAMMGAITQCVTHMQISEPLPAFPTFDPPPRPQSQVAEEGNSEKNEEENEEGGEKKKAKKKKLNKEMSKMKR